MQSLLCSAVLHGAVDPWLLCVCMLIAEGFAPALSWEHRSAAGLRGGGEQRDGSWRRPR